MQEKYANRLRSETSPYLLQHAHNPVDWYPWGEEALERARQEDKPIFLSIGYSACHWCHVMERESFESDEIARIMNESFINIKVDREERPDLDAIYMNFVQLTTGSGGWPMSVFLTPEGVPFFGGTYFPPEDYYGRPGFKRVLESVAFYYKNRRDELLQNKDEILHNLQRMAQVPESRVVLDENILDNAYQSLVQRFDPIYGGFGQAPKFPPSMNIMFLLRHHLRHPLSKALDMAEHTLRKMAEGGLYDQLGGGFHRYSVDNHWLVPHFEKMLYDNALLSQVYLEAYQLTRRPQYRRIVEETLRYILREMTGHEGGFYSAQDADSEGEEGKFFVWTRDEIEALLDKDEAAVVCRYYGVTASGNFEGKNILHVSVDSEKVAQEFGRSEEEIVPLLESGKRKLWQKREERVRPGTDTKVLTAWNGLMMLALVNAYEVLRDRDYLEAAEKNADFLLARLQKEGRLLRTYREGQAKLDGYLEDYANLALALVALYEATFAMRRLHEAQRLAEIMLAEFWDEREKGFFFTGTEHEPLIVRHKEYYDNATPSGNSVAALVLLKLTHLTGERKYQQHAEQVLQRVAQSIVQIPVVFGYQLCALDWYLDSVREFALVAPPGEREPFLKPIFERFIPNKVVAGIAPGERSDLPLLAGRESAIQQPAVYVCENFTCKQPITEVAQLAQQLEQMVPSASSCSPQPHTSIHSPQT